MQRLVVISNTDGPHGGRVREVCRGCCIEYKQWLRLVMSVGDEKVSEI
jgi:hypothetical protein